MILFSGSVSDTMFWFVTFHDQAPDHWFPSTRMYWLLAPAARMPLMAAWLSCRTRSWLMVWYSLLVSKTTRWLEANSRAKLVKKVWKSEVEVMTLPWKRP